MDCEFVLPVSVYQDKAYNKLRGAYMISIANFLNDYLIDEEINQHRDMILALEQSGYAHAVEVAENEVLPVDFDNPAFNHLYRTKLMRITKHLDISSEVGDDHLASMLLDSKIDPLKVSKLANEDLSPCHNNQLIETLNTRRNQCTTLKTSTLYRCKKCNKKETTVRSVQMRSLDEGESIVVNCVFCGYKWFI